MSERLTCKVWHDRLVGERESGLYRWVVDYQQRGVDQSTNGTTRISTGGLAPPLTRARKVTVTRGASW
jgi:hypothetical protein